ncbi:hypothetical protein BO221_37735 [Archangium sp. Cb G35]|uniref:hypothetical protein n=1 Tax=Archangium sp. Cb G35 TaxID=1920190 RepID=UPI000936CFAC|nr:hypothetical protein [Archangium sp. Cb G35]OJT19234.1 hypothetical protein BO221_37735 [Archangium sp. Cb G35]
MHEPPASPPLPRWRHTLLELLLTTLLLAGMFLWFPLMRTDAFWAQLEGPSIGGLSLALALLPALLVHRLSFPFFDAFLERDGEMAADRIDKPHDLAAVVIQLRPFRSLRVRQATTFLTFFNLLASSSALALWHGHSTAHASERLEVRCQVTGFKKGRGEDSRWILTFECPLPGAAPATAQTRLPEWQWLEGTPPPHALRARLQRGGLGGWLVPLETVELEARRPTR